ncbi:hypothetical protein COLO4_09064 [Corchorus olitorius]|uniref:tRNA (guanine-N(7)-)-methyltransferase non-catalytic subunit n=1 Tax=Corchorus olitorius TaxID=93759 RepID=A0A1R3KDC9_9ROSI|nr:hypothetical protein COLO4_09064 [Corchorus olitorius]
MSGLIEGLPDAVALRCLARVPFYLYPKLELVSRSWKAVIRSTELFKARQEVGSAEELLCVCAFDPENLWQMYDPLRDLWITLPVLPSKIRHLAHFGAVSTGGKLFVLGGGSDAVDPSTGDQDGSFATNEVWSYDPIMRRWDQRASMILPRAMFACCVLKGKIIVAGGFTSCRKSISQAEMYDPEKDVWITIPDLHRTHNSACTGLVIGGKLHVLHKGLSTVQVLDHVGSGWTVEDYSWLQGPMAVVQGDLYVMSHGLIFKQEKEVRKVVVSASEFRRRIGFAMTGLRDEIYVIGGVIGPDRFNWDIKPMSDVDVLTELGREVVSMEDTGIEECEHDNNETNINDKPEEDTQFEESEQNNKDVEVAPALISVHPTQNSVAVAVGSDLRVFNLLEDCAVNLVDGSAGASHSDSIRAIRYGANGKLFVSAGDDKLVKVWSTESWRCISTVCSEKRVSAVAIGNDGLHVCFADKFGVVWVVDLPVDGSEAPLNKKAVPLLAHYCSIITSLEFSPDGRFIISADRDFKIRVTVFPKKPLDGAHEIQSFCLGHTEFVSCLAFICTPECSQGILVSGGGDSTVRMWDIISGSLLDTCDVGAKAGHLKTDASEANYSTITDICTIPDCTLIAVAFQSLQGIMLLSCDLQSQTLSVAKLVSIVGESFIPTSLGSSISGGLLWMVTGASKLHGSDVSSLSGVKVISGFKKSSPDSLDQEAVVLEDNEIPGGSKLLEKLQGSISIDEKVFLAAAEAVKTAMCNLLIKKQYSVEKREFRKRTRNDKKVKQ